MNFWYPLQFKPILKTALWGTESWDLVDLGNNISVVSNGPFAGFSLRKLLEEHGEEILGKTIFQKTSGKFPLLIKRINAADLLSLQVHPDDAYARKHEKGQRGKNEMWYILQAKKGADLICGFKPGVLEPQFQTAMEINQFNGLIQFYETHEGDVFYVPAGTIHAIGGGNVLFEIQVPSQLTYRIYDWDRVDADGKPRPTHRKKAVKVLKFNPPGAGKIQTKIMEDAGGVKKEALIQSADFAVEKWTLKQEALDPHNENKPAVYCVIEGKGTLRYGKDLNLSVSVNPFETFLIPASLHPLQIVPQGASSLLLLRILP